MLELNRPDTAVVSRDVARRRCKMKLTPKGKRKGLELNWEALVNGDAALAAALNASVGKLSAPRLVTRMRTQKLMALDRHPCSTQSCRRHARTEPR
jgi:hypothetical protein